MKKMTKKLIAGTLITASALTFTACSKKQTDIWSPRDNYGGDVYGPPTMYESGSLPYSFRSGEQTGDPAANTPAV